MTSYLRNLFYVNNNDVVHNMHLAAQLSRLTSGLIREITESMTNKLSKDQSYSVAPNIK